MKNNKLQIVGWVIISLWVIQEIMKPKLGFTNFLSPNIDNGNNQYFGLGANIGTSFFYSVFIFSLIKAIFKKQLPILFSTNTIHRRLSNFGLFLIINLFILFLSCLLF